MTTRSIYKTSAGEAAVMALYDRVLAQWPVPCEKLNLATPFGNTFVIVSGQASAPALVLLHGAGTNSAIWAGDVAEYSRHYRVYAIDLLGEVGKSAPDRHPWNGPAYAEWLDAVLNALKIDQAILAGISQGAWTALKYTAYKPERVAKLVLMTPGGIIADRMSFLVYAVLYSMTGKWGTKRMVGLLSGDKPAPEGFEEITATITRHFVPRVGVLPIFTDEELRCVTMPTLLLGGARDALRNLEQIAARLRPLAPRLNVVIIPGAGHALYDSQEYIMPFLAPGKA